MSCMPPCRPESLASPDPMWLNGQGAGSAHGQPRGNQEQNQWQSQNSVVSGGSVSHGAFTATGAVQTGFDRRMYAALDQSSALARIPGLSPAPFCMRCACRCLQDMHGRFFPYGMYPMNRAHRMHCMYHIVWHCMYGIACFFRGRQQYIECNVMLRIVGH